MLKHVAERVCVRMEMMETEFSVTVRLVRVDQTARYLTTPTERSTYVVMVELVSKRQQVSTRTLLGAYTIDQLLVVRNNCCLRDVVYRLLRAAFLCINREMSPVLFQLQDCPKITPISYVLPQDLIIDILSMLPVKTLLRFKAVCKTWNKIISSSCFERQHFVREGNRNHLLVCWRGDLDITQDDYFEQVESVSLFSNVELDKGLFALKEVSEVCGPCYGILCVCFDFETFALWNPATRKMWPIPESPLFGQVADVSFSFWIYPLTNEFKIFWMVREGLLCNEDPRIPRFVTYTSCNDSWKELEAPFYADDHVVRRHCYRYPVSNGYYYFLKYNWTIATRHAIIAYDIFNDDFQEIRMPKIEIDSGLHINLDFYGDSLALFAYKNVRVGAHTEIWVMKEKGCWTKIFNVDIPMDEPGNCEPLGFWKGNEVFIHLTYNVPHMCELMIYDPISGKRRKILVETREGDFWGDLFPLCYKESLISVKIKDS